MDRIIVDQEAQRTGIELAKKAIEMRASDMHFQHMSTQEVWVRFRIDGQLIVVGMINPEEGRRLISAYKVLSEMKLDECRIPQDGKFSIKVGEFSYDLRLNTVPSAAARNGRGEDLAIRILDRATAARSLDELGFSKPHQQQLELLYRQPYGMMVFTGPTGSGKSTTQCAILSVLNKEWRMILTVEDPVEYATDGITQVQVNTRAGMDYSHAIRAFLRHDPDVIMVGEMRDKETAEAAIECALTGHLVLSTLHTNNAPAAISRLIDMGIPPYHIPDTISGVIAQRLARRICPKCKASYEIEADKLRLLGYKAITDSDKVTVYKGTGCDNCNKVGTRGRIGIYEVMVMDDDINNLVTSRVGTVEIRKVAVEKGMKTLRADALEKVLSGMIPLRKRLLFPTLRVQTACKFNYFQNIWMVNQTILFYCKQKNSTIHI